MSRNRHLPLSRSIVKSPKLASIFGELNYVETAPQYQAPKKDGKADKPKADKPKVEAAAAPKKEKAAKKPAADDDDDEPMVPAEPKVKNPLDDLPKSSFIMDEWKRKYSNEDTITGALPWFYEKYVVVALLPFARLLITRIFTASTPKDTRSGESTTSTTTN